MKDTTFQTLNFIFKRMGTLAPCKTPEEALRLLRHWAKHHPAELAKQIENFVQKSIRAYNLANDGQNPESLRITADLDYEVYTSRIEEIMALLGIQVFWPGLEPAYKKGVYTVYTAHQALTSLFPKQDFLPIEGKEG